MTTISVFHRAGPDRQPLLHLRPCLRQHRNAVGGHVRRVRRAAGRRPLPGVQRYRARLRPGSYPSIYLLRRPPRMPCPWSVLPSLNHLARIPCAIDAAKGAEKLDHRVGASNTRQKPAAHVVWCWAWDGAPITCFFVFFYPAVCDTMMMGSTVSLCSQNPQMLIIFSALFGYIGHLDPNQSIKS